MTTPDPTPDWYQIPRSVEGINVRPSGTQPNLAAMPPFLDLFTAAAPRVVSTLREVFDTWVAQVVASTNTAIDWAETIFGVDAQWARDLVDEIDWERAWDDIKLIVYPFTHLTTADVDDWQTAWDKWIDLQEVFQDYWDSLWEGLFNAFFTILHLDPPDWDRVNGDLKRVRLPFTHLLTATVGEWFDAWAAWLDLQEAMQEVWDAILEGIVNMVFAAMHLPAPDWPTINGYIRRIRKPFFHLLPVGSPSDPEAYIPAATWADWKDAWYAWLDLQDEMSNVWNAFVEGLANLVFIAFGLPTPDWAAVNEDLRKIRYPFTHLLPVGEPLEEHYRPAATWYDWMLAWKAWLDLQEQLSIVWDALWEGLYNLLFDWLHLPRPEWSTVNGYLHTIRYPFLHLMASGDPNEPETYWPAATWTDWVAAWDAAVGLFHEMNIISTGFWRGVLSVILGWLNLPAPQWDVIDAAWATVWHPFKTPGASAGDWTNAWNAFLSLLGGLGMSHPDNNWWLSLFGLGGLDGSADWVNDIFATVWSWITGEVPIGSLRVTNRNLLINPDFEGSISLSGGSGWSWDAAVNFGGGSTGSARVDADGTPKGLTSNPTRVAAGESLDYSVQVLASSLTGSGSPVQLSVKTNTGAVVVLASARPADPADGWSGVPAGAVAATLEGTYEVEDPAVTEVAMRLGLTGDAPAGSVWFDKAVERRSGSDRFTTDIEKILEPLADLGNPVAWQHAWDGLVDIFNMWFVPTENWRTPTPAAFLGDFQTLGDAFWAWITHLDQPAKWTALVNAFKTVVGKFIDTDTWGVPGIAGFLQALQDLGDAFWAWITHLDQPAKWTDLVAKFNALLGYFINTSSWGVPGAAAFIGTTQGLGDAFWDWITHLDKPAKWAALIDAVNDFLSYFIDTSAWGVPGIVGFLEALQDLGDAFWDWITHLNAATKWTTLVAAFKSVVGYFVDTSGWGTPGIAGFMTALQQLGDALIALIKDLGTASRWTTAWSKLVAVLGYFINTTGWATPNPSNWLTKLNTAVDALIALFNDLLNGTKWTAAWSAVLDVLGLLGVKNKTAPAAATVWSGLAGQTGATQANAWLARLFEDLVILIDLFHWTYAEGSSSDATNKTSTTPGIGYGKRTWWSAWNDVRDLLFASNTPQPAQSIATDINAGVATMHNKTQLLDAVTGQLPAATGLSGSLAQSKIADLPADLDKLRIGSGISLGRSSGTAVNFGTTTSGDPKRFGLPTSFFDIQHWRSSDMTATTVTLGGNDFFAVKVDKPGLYLCEFSFSLTAGVFTIPVGHTSFRGGVSAQVLTSGGSSKYVTVASLVSGDLTAPIYTMMATMAVLIDGPNQYVMPSIAMISSANDAKVYGEGSSWFTRFALTRAGGPQDV